MAALDPLDRALIDAAVRAGRVRVIPRGVSGLADPTTGQSWADARKAYFDLQRRGERLRSAQGVKTQRQQRAESKERTSSKRGEVTAKLRALMGEGLTYDQMAARLGMAKSNVWRLCQKLAGDQLAPNS